MCHVLLEHRFTTVLVREGDNCRNSDRDQELEAAELSGELLVPADAARSMGRRGLSDEEVARSFAVSVEMARWRMQISGARKIQRNIAARRS
jgi:Zn-dependent peptidase ImmA (M78 family)